jgi:hypothetical protein
VLNCMVRHALICYRCSHVLLTHSFYKHLAVKTLSCHYNCYMWYKVNTVCIPGAASSSAGGIYFSWFEINQCNKWHTQKMAVILTWCGDVSYYWKLRVLCDIEILRSSEFCNRQTDITDRYWQAHLCQLVGKHYGQQIQKLTTQGKA